MFKSRGRVPDRVWPVSHITLCDLGLHHHTNHKLIIRPSERGWKFVFFVISVLVGISVSDHSGLPWYLLESHRTCYHYLAFLVGPHHPHSLNRIQTELISRSFSLVWCRSEKRREGNMRFLTFLPFLPSVHPPQNAHLWSLTPPGWHEDNPGLGFIIVSLLITLQNFAFFWNLAALFCVKVKLRGKTWDKDEYVGRLSKLVPQTIEEGNTMTQEVSSFGYHFPITS